MDSWALRTELDLETVNVHLTALQAAGLLGIVEEGGRATAYFPRRVEGLPVPGLWEPVADTDWVAAWRERVEPVRVGPLVVAPPWKASHGPGVIVIEPGQAFGTGHHETTAGCLAALCELELDGRSVLDVGTGSGVLAVAAARLGARAVVAVDLDAIAVDAARDAASRNDVAVAVVHGSVDAAPPGPYDVVVGNLDTATLVALAAELVSRVRPGGTLVASGVSLEREHEAVTAFSSSGLAVLPRRGREWVVLTGRTAP